MSTRKMKSLKQQISNGQKSRILVVDDDSSYCSLLGIALSRIGYLVEEAASGKEALTLLVQQDYDVIILDLNMPYVSGLEVIEQVEQLQLQLSIIILTCNPTLESAIFGVKSEKVVNYLVKPTPLVEIVMAIQEALQKQQNYKTEVAQLVGDSLEEIEQYNSKRESPAESTANRPVITVPPLELNRPKHVVKFVNKSVRPVNLTKGEMGVLSALMSYPNRPLSCRQLVRMTWEYDLDENEAANVIRPYISRIRRKIEPESGAPSIILTIRGRGYLFAPDESNMLS